VFGGACGKIATQAQDLQPGTVAPRWQMARKARTEAPVATILAIYFTPGRIY